MVHVYLAVSKSLSPRNIYIHHILKRKTVFSEKEMDSFLCAFGKYCRRKKQTNKKKKTVYKIRAQRKERKRKEKENNNKQTKNKRNKNCGLNPSKLSANLQYIPLW